MIDLNICLEEKADGSRCYKQCQHGDTMCKLHRTVADRREQKRRATIIWGDMLDMLWAGGPPIQEFNQVTALLDEALDVDWINRATYDDLVLHIRDEWAFYREQRLVPTAKATTELQRLALDNQNVHTKEVNQQTSDAMKYLLETSVPNGQDTLAELETAWTDKKQVKKVLRDVKLWYGMKTCVRTDDYLYKHMLDGLWVRIKQHKERQELTQRLWEEAFESVDKCCQGHLSRLANVLVGFTEEVKAEVPLGEILQQKMSVIAAKEIDVLHKVCEAWFVCEELKVPQEERTAWIDAF